MELNLYGDTRIDGYALAACRLETNLFGGADGSLVESVPQLSNHAQHSNLIRGGAFDLEHHGALDAERLGFVRVPRLRFEENLDGGDAEGGGWFGGLRDRWRRRRFTIKSRRRDHSRRKRANPARGGIAKSRRR